MTPQQAVAQSQEYPTPAEAHAVPTPARHQRQEVPPPAQKAGPKVLKVPTGSIPVYPHSSRIPQRGVGGRVASPKEAQAKSTAEKAKLAPVSQANWERYVKDLEEI